jgi:RNA polymerase sigma-70 factor (ECF subfamily)
MLAIRSKTPPNSASGIVEINGQPGIVSYIGDRPHRVITFDFANDRIQSIFITVNPDKLQLRGDLNKPQEGSG